jgi:hypothetical protein
MPHFDLELSRKGMSIWNREIYPSSEESFDAKHLLVDLDLLGCRFEPCR